MLMHYQNNFFAILDMKLALLIKFRSLLPPASPVGNVYNYSTYPCSGNLLTHTTLVHTCNTHHMISSMLSSFILCVSRVGGPVSEFSATLAATQVLMETHCNTSISQCGLSLAVE